MMDLELMEQWIDEIARSGDVFGITVMERQIFIVVPPN